MKVKNNASVGNRLKRSGQLYLIMMPAFLATVLFSYVPMYGIVLAFQKYNPTKSMFDQQWVGLRYFEKLFEMADFYKILGNTLVIAVLKIVTLLLFSLVLALLLNELKSRALRSVTQSLMMLLTVSAAYPLSFPDKDFFGRRFFAVFFFISMLFSGGIIPYYILIKDLGLTNTIWALVLGGVPVGNMIILMNFFRMLPRAILESAYLDGASHFQVLFRIYLPMSKPSIATLSLMCLVGHWNDWFGGLIYMKDMDMYPLQTYIYTALQKTGTYADVASGAAGAPRQAINATLIVLSIIPVIIVFPLLSRHIKEGMVLGAVKE